MSPEIPTAVSSRRELNKENTRSSIAAAALALLRQRTGGSMTAEEVAESAGVSRRTFFNYFPSVEAALNVPTEDFLNRALENLDALHDDLPVMEAAVRALQSMADPELLSPVAELFVLSSGNAQLGRLQLESWENCSTRLVEIVRERINGNQRLAVAVFAHSIIGAGKAAFVDWAEDWGHDLSEPSMQALKQSLINALALLRDGFPTLRMQADSTARKA